MTEVALIEYKDTVAKPVKDQSSHVGRSFYLQILRIILRIMLEENNRILQPLCHQLMHQCTVLTQTVRMVALRDDNHFGMLFQTGNHFIRLCHIRHKQEFEFCITSSHQRQLLMIISRPSTGFSGPYVRIKNIVHTFFPLFGQSTSGINIVRSKLRIHFGLPVHTVGNDHRHVFTSYIADSPRLTAFGRQIVKSRRFQSGNIRMIPPQQDIVHQLTGNRNFRFGSFAQRYPYSIPQSVGQQRTNAESGLDTSVLTVSGFCYSEMQRESHPFFLHHSYQQTNGFHHDNRIGRFDGNNYIGKVLINTNAKKLHTRLYHAFGRITITGHDAVGQRAVIHTDTDSRMILFADIQKRHKAVMNFLYFLRILLVGIFQLLKSTCSVYIIPRIDAYLFRISGCHIGYFRIKVYIGNQRNHIFLTAQTDVNIFQVLRFLDTLRRQTDILTARVDNTFRLFHTSLRILRRRIGHRLDTNRIGATQRYGPNIHFGSFPPKIIE